MAMMELVVTISGIIGIFVSVYQAAQLSASKERLKEVQYVLAALNSAAISKQGAWQNQLRFYSNPESEKDKEIFRAHARARDDFADLAQLASALEGTISSSSSAMTDSMEKAIKQQKLNNELQAEGLKNPTLNQGHQV
jgi:hypothetical protein